MSVLGVKTSAIADSRGQQERAPESISVVVPLYNEAGNVRLLVSRLHKVLSSIAHIYEIVLVDDGSQDMTWNTIVDLTTPTPGQGLSANGSTIIGCRLSRNFGHQPALLAGLTAAHGDVVVTMDGDLQHPPEVIPDLVKQWQIGFDIVGTERIDGGHTSAFKRLTSRYFYRVFSALSEVELRKGSSDFRLVDRRVLQEILRLRDSSLFLRGTVQWVGFRTTTISYQLDERFSGHSKYNLLRMMKFAGSAIVSHSTVPLRLGVWIGIITCLLAFMEILYAIAMTLTGRTVPGWASILIIQSFFFGVLFVLLGIMGTYLAGIYRMLQSRPNFIIADTIASRLDPEPMRFRLHARGDAVP